MASPPFNLDIANPNDTGITAQFPANERTYRDNVASYLNTEHDVNTGYHKFQQLTTTQKNNLSSPPAGMFVFDTTAAQLQLNTGTPGAPIWTPVIVGNPPGTMIDFAGPAAPSGYLVCDGSAISRTTYAALFTAIGVAWGNGDGVTTFNLPSMSRRATVGSGGTSTGTLSNTVGSIGGEETHTQAVAELPAHNHPATVTDPGHAHGNPASSGTGAAFIITGNNSAQTTTINTNTAVTGITVSTSNTGSGTPFNVIQPSAVVLKCIKT